MRIPKTRRRQRPYSLEEYETIRRLAGEGLSQLQIAKAMGRSLGSVAGTVGRLGITTHGGRGGRPFHGRN
jgi:hypothetical protein